jgi:hypothetical protein
LSNWKGPDIERIKLNKQLSREGCIKEEAFTGKRIIWFKYKTKLIEIAKAIEDKGWIDGSYIQIIDKNFCNKHGNSFSNVKQSANNMLRNK